jgi:choloylglycine hydrolase
MNRTTHRLSALFAVSVLTWAASPAWACTTFLVTLDEEHAVGNSYDWDIGCANVTVNSRGEAKRALLLPGQTPAEWVSRYGSITINQYGHENPTAGMNEAGLVVEQMWLDDTEYPPADDAPALGELQWMQYMLDNFGTVAEVVDGASGVRVSSFFATIHYLVCDVTGECATFEYLDGALVITSGDDIVVDTLTNSTYADSVAFLAEHVGFGGDLEIPTGMGSLDRFVRASALALEETEDVLPDRAFSILDSVNVGPRSQWNLVWMPGQGRLYFRTHTTPTIKFVDLADFDLDCTAGPMVLDIDTEAEGHVADRFVEYTTDANRTLLEESMADMIDDLGPVVFELLVTYPESVTCTLETEDGGPDGDADGDIDGDGDGDGDADGDADGDGDGGGDADADDGSGDGGEDDGCSCTAATHEGLGAGALLAAIVLGAALVLRRLDRGR